MSTIKSSAENLTLNADGSGNDIKFQSNGSNVATLSDAGLLDVVGELRVTNPSATSQLYLYGAAGQKANLKLNEYGVRTWDIGAGTQSSGHFSITGGDAEYVRVEHGGDVDIKAGNLVIGTAGKGIDFSAATDLAGMTSELLDDYEEGTFTPDTSWTTDSINSSNCLYTKIGRMVHCQMYFHATPNNTSINISGLPFSGVKSSTWSLGMQDDLYTRFTRMDNNNSLVGSLSSSSGSSLEMYISVTYQTA